MDSTDPLPSSGVPRPEPRASIDMTNRARTLRVKVSEFGLPLEVHIEPDMLSRGASALAQEIKNLCELGAARCGARHGARSLPKAASLTTYSTGSAWRRQLKSPI